MGAAILLAHVELRRRWVGLVALGVLAGLVAGVALGAVFGVAGLVAAWTVLTSLDRLVATPARFGWGHDVTVVDVDDELVDAFVADDRLVSVVATRTVEIELDGEQAFAYGLDVRRGGLGLPVLRGRLPSGPGEVALGPALQDRLGVGEGDVVEAVTAEAGRTPLVVVGSVLTEDVEDFGGSAVLTGPGLDALSPPGDGFRSAWVTWADDVDADAATATLATDLAVPAAALTLVVPAAGVAGVLLAALPAHRAAHVAAAVALRAE